MAFLERNANRGSISTGYDVDNSLKFEPDNSEYLKSNNTHAGTSPTSNQKGTVSFWIKRTEIGNNVSGKQMYIFASANSARYSNLGFDEFDNLTVYSGDSSWNSVSPYTLNKFRDTAAWYHIVIRYDTTDSTASNRLRVYANGTEVSWAVAPNITQNGAMTYGDLGGPTWHSWGTVYSYHSPAKFFGGYLAEAHFVDGQSLAPTEFAEYDTSGIWKPKAYTGTYGNAGYYLDFADSGNLGDDESGNGFDFDENNIAAADQATDTPTNNFATWQTNIKYNPSVSADFSFSEGGTSPKRNSGDVHVYCVSTIAMSSGKWYMEYKIRNGGDYVYFGGTPITKFASENHNGYYLGQDGGGSIGYGVADGNIYYWTGANGQFTETNSTGDIIGIALDKDNDKIAFSKNGTYMQGSNGTRSDPTTPSTMHEVQAPPYFWAMGAYSGNVEYQTNMGGFTDMSISSPASDENGYGTFEYAPPTGYYSLCSKNLAEYG